MRKMHWSEPYLNFITVEVTYEDGAVQTWDYDCIQYLSEETVKTDMTNDFKDPRMDRAGVMVYATRVDSTLSADLGQTLKIGKEFTDEVFAAIGELHGN